MINPLIISRLIEAGHTVYLPVDGSSIILMRLPECSASIEVFCTNASQDKDHSPILRCPTEAMMTAVVDVPTRCVWLVPASLVEGRKNLRLGEEMEEFIIPEPLSPSFREAQELRRRRLEELEEDVKKSIERMKGDVE